MPAVAALFFIPCGVESFSNLSKRIHTPNTNTDCLAALNGVCTKRNTARFELLPFENEVNNNSQYTLLRQLYHS